MGMKNLEPEATKSAQVSATNNLGIIAPGGFFGNQLTNQYFSCPIDVPFCARKACTSHFDNEKNAYTCYSEPGCCFDQNLYLHKRMFGDTFYQHVPACYRAIDNPLFNQLSEEVTNQGNQFNPSYIGPIVNKVVSFMNSPLANSRKYLFSLKN